MRNQQRRQQTITSALWAAYGDALGFPTELASTAIVKRRIGELRASRTKPWVRMVGGKFGARVELPEGAYSDDTQLRLATSRSIRGDGTFDVESFAKIELPVWLTYCLGAGRGSKAAASSLASKKTAWFSNFFSSEGSVYVNGGGNGAAMRIQPHVWASVDLGNAESFLPDVVRNAVCTHGHVRGIAGAMIHAVCLAEVMRSGRAPPRSQWRRLANVIEQLPYLISRDSDLRTFWLPTWEARSKSSLAKEVAIVCDEWTHAVDVATSCRESSPIQSYVRVVETLGGLSDAERGSGLKCALFALVAAVELGSLGTEKAIEIVVNLLNSDTDTIASMAGALLGARTGESAPSFGLQDSNYIEIEAGRMFDISQGGEANSFTYPDLLYWQPPKTPLDAVANHSGETVLSGLGLLQSMGDVHHSTQKGPEYQWFRIDFGQTVLCKRRAVLKKLSETSLPGQPMVQGRSDVRKIVPRITAQAEVTPQMEDMFNQNLTIDSRNEENAFSLDHVTDLAIRSNFDPRLIGEQLLRFADSDKSLELAIGYAAIIVKAKRARRNKSSSVD
jgi:ADP-ribosylglycohydrolase